MIFGWFWRKREEKRYDWAPFIKDGQPEEFFADVIVGLLTLASFEHGILKVNFQDLRQVLLTLDEEFCLSKALPVDDSCGYPYPFSSISKVLPMALERGVSQIDSFHWGVPNEVIPKNLQHLSERRGFIKALYPVVDRFVELVTRHKRRGYAAED